MDTKGIIIWIICKWKLLKNIVIMQSSTTQCKDTAGQERVYYGVGVLFVNEQKTLSLNFISLLAKASICLKTFI